MFEGLKRPAAAVSLKLDTSPIDSFLEQLLAGRACGLCVRAPRQAAD